MATSLSCFLLLLLVCHVSPSAIALSLTAPAFIWSDYRSHGLDSQAVVDYKVISSQTLVDTLMQKFGWSSLLCTSNGGGEASLDTVVAFVGNQLYSEDISRDLSDDTSPLLSILKESFKMSKYSMALPYVSTPGESRGILHILVSAMRDSCDLKSRPGKVLMVGSCPKETFNPKWPLLTEGFQTVEDADMAKKFILDRKESRGSSEMDIILVCPMSDGGTVDLPSEGDMLASVLSALRQSGTSNAVLYVSDPLNTGYGHEGRVLASSNATATRTSSCDEVCQTVASLYEGIIVAVTLLIILISGLCCMMGIDTPSRFETAQES